MKRIAIGAVTGLAVWFAGAVAAEAQQITPTGPMKITASDTSTVYSATITTNSNFWLYMTVTNNGISVYNMQWYITNSGPSYNFQTPVLDTTAWGLVAGNTIDFHIAVAVTPTHRVNSDYYLTVQTGGTTMVPSSKTDVMLAGALPGRKEEVVDVAALDDRRTA